MSTVSPEKIQRAYAKLVAFLSQPEAREALERASKSKRLLRKAVADPKAFLKSEGLKPPARSELSIFRQPLPEARFALPVPIWVCIRIGPIWICIDITRFP
jgi:hypothetical protein